MYKLSHQRNTAMLFEVKGASRALQCCLLVVILLLSIPEAAHAFVVTTALQSKTTDINSVCLGVGLNACGTRCVTRTNEFKVRTTGIDRSVLWTSRLSKSGGPRHRVRPILHGGTGCSGGDGGLADRHALVDYYSHETNNEQGYHGHTSNKMSATDGIERSERAGGGGFNWLQEFGNGRADIVGLVLSTVFLMTVMIPLNLDSATADVAIKDTRRINGQESGMATHVTVEGSHIPLVAAGGGKHKEQMMKRERVHALQPSAIMHRHVEPIDIRKVRLHFGGNSEKRKFSSKSSTRIRGREGAAKQGHIKRVKGTASRGSFLDHRNRQARVTSIFQNVATQPVSPIKSDERDRQSKLHSGKIEGHPSISSKMKAWKPPVKTPQDTSTVEKNTYAAPKTSSDEREQLKELQKKHVEMFRDPLPVPVLPESFNRALHGALPALMPPAMMLLFLISMPVIILFLKGVGTTLFAILKYGNDDRHQENPEEHPGNLEVGYGGAPKTHKEKRHGNRHLETPGSAFSFFLGGGRGGSGNDSSGDGENKVGGSVRRAERMTTGEPKTVQYVHTHRRGFFDNERPSAAQSGAEQGRAGGDKSSSRGVGNISDDAMAAMAMAAMTQKLDQMKRSLQDEVQMMKTELVQASDESERLMDKLHRLEEENKQLGEVASRLGGQDARLLKAELFSLLSTPSFGDQLSLA